MSEDIESPFGQNLRSWRRIRGVSQLALATETGVSARHISFIETGRARPGRKLVIRLADFLDVPPRERNQLLESAGLLPIYRERDLSDEQMAPYQRIVQRMLKNHEPYPAFVLDRWWNVLGGNDAAESYLPASMKYGFNAVDNFLNCFQPESGEWREAAWGFYARVRKAWTVTGHDVQLGTFMERFEAALENYPPPESTFTSDSPELLSQIDVAGTSVSIVSTMVRFETSRDITLNELVVELIFPADDESDTFMQSLYREKSTGD